MTTRSYEVIGEHSAPEDFENYLVRMFRKGELSITAKEINVDELATRRGNTDTEIAFDFRIRETHYNDSDQLVVGGYMYQNGEKGSYILIEVTDRARFDIFD